MHRIEIEPRPSREPRGAAAAPRAMPVARRVRAGTPRRLYVAGFTMTELLITVSVAAILATVAVPSFSGLIASQRARSFAAELDASLLETRAHALGLNQPVSLVPKSGGWPAGWRIQDPAQDVLEDHGPATGVTVTGPASVQYLPSGHLPLGSTPPVFVITTTSGGHTDYQCVSVDLSGRPYMRASSTCT